MSAAAVLEPLPEAVRPHPLDVFFAPGSVAIFGATEAPGSAGRALMANLINNPFGGTLYPINPGRVGTLGVRAYPRLADVPEPIELALIATPAPAVPDLLAECAAAGVQGAIIFSAGPELGERRIQECLRGSRLRVVGPNSLGVVRPHLGLNATFAPATPRAGNVGFLSQSGALLAALQAQIPPEDVGCSAFVSVGSLLDVRWAEWLEYLAEDPRTECIGIYAEAIEDPRSFFTAARKVAPHKPIILVKGGQAERNEVFDEACRSTGVLRVVKIADLFRMAGVLTTQPAARGRHLTILSNARGPAVLAADTLLADGGRLTELAPATVAALDALLGPRWNRQNPIDVGDDAGPYRFAQAAQLAAQDPGSDALLVLLAPHSVIDPSSAAQQLTAIGGVGRPVLACWLWGASSPTGVAPLRAAGIPTFFSPEAAVRAFGYLWRHGENLRCLGRLVAALDEDERLPDRPRAFDTIEAARRSGRTLLSEPEAHELLSAYHLPMPQAVHARSEDEAVAAATGVGYPVVLGLADESALLGAEGAVVRLHAADAEGVRRAWRTLALVAQEHLGAGAHPEAFRGVTVRSLLRRAGHELAVRSRSDPGIGPVLEVAGTVSGGNPGCRAFVLPPLSPDLIRELIEQTAPFAALRREGTDWPPLEQFFQRFSRLVVEQRWLAEVFLDLVVSPERVTVLEARVLLHGPGAREDQLPAPVLSEEGRGPDSPPGARR